MDVSCPYCGLRLTGHAQAYAGAPPIPFAGAVSICLYCAHISLFDEGPLGLYLRFPTPEEWTELRADEALLTAQATVEKERWRWQG